MQLNADPMWGMPCIAYNIQCRPCAEARDAMGLVQRALQQGPCPINPVPPQSLHVSIFAVVPVRWPDSGKEEHWRAISGRCLADLQRLCRDGEPFVLEFIKLKVAPDAIVALAVDASGTVERLRRHFRESARHPALPMPRYDIIHATLARFRSSAMLADHEKAALEARELSIRASITHIELVRESVYPSLELECLARVPLGIA